MMQDHWEQRTDGSPVRVLRDPSTGRKWRVWVGAAEREPGAPASLCLIFDAGDLVRRAWEVPDDWGRMTPDVLIGLATPELRRGSDRAALGLPSWERRTARRGDPGPD